MHGPCVLSLIDHSHLSPSLMWAPSHNSMIALCACTENTLLAMLPIAISLSLSLLLFSFLLTLLSVSVHLFSCIRFSFLSHLFPKRSFPFIHSNQAVPLYAQ